jgi:hypothetical protein
MGIISRLFGGNKEDKALRDVFEHIRRILDDEDFQNNLVHPAVKQLLLSAPAYDKDPDGTGPFGLTEANPIPVNGPVGELAYLSRLETLSGQRILFHRIGAIGTVDVFEAVAFDGSEWFVLFADFYHPRRSRLTPEGFGFTKDLAQFSGFHKFCENFPYDFIEKKASDRESGLSMAYIPVGKISTQIEERVFKRPLAHEAKLELVRSRLSSSLGQ